MNNSSRRLNGNRAYTPNSRRGGNQRYNGPPSNGTRQPGGTGNGGGAIKSGMTVEDLKKLTQQRMSSGKPVVATNHPAAKPIATHHHPQPQPNSLNGRKPMTVEELKQLTNLRLASQNAPSQQTEVSSLVNRAVLSHAGKAHYQQSMQVGGVPPGQPSPGGTMVPKSTSELYKKPTPKHTATARAAAASAVTRKKSISGPSAGGPPSLSDLSANTKPYMPQSMPIMSAVNTSSADEERRQLDQAIRDFRAKDISSEEKSRIGIKSLDTLLQLDSDIPPPPPTEPSKLSWSPPNKSRKELTSSPYSAFFSPTVTTDEKTVDSTTTTIPFTGLSRRPSMTVPWQVAESVLNTPQPNTNRKRVDTVVSVSSLSVENASIVSSSGFKDTDDEDDSENSSESDTEEEMDMISSPPPPPPSSPPPRIGSPAHSRVSRQSSGGSSVGPPPVGLSRRGSFGNAAQFFRFRRRSKSRLDFAPEFESGSIDETMRMPGISENGTHHKPGQSKTRVEDPSSPFFSNDKRTDPSPFGNRMMMNSNESKDDKDINDENVGGSVNGPGIARKQSDGNLPPFFNGSRPGGNLPPRSISVPSMSEPISPRDLPAMSPNGEKLRKVAELVRRGSLSSQDKTRLKDALIQNSLNESNNLAMISKIKVQMGQKLDKARKKLERKNSDSQILAAMRRSSKDIRDMTPRSTSKSPVHRRKEPSSVTSSPGQSRNLRPPPGFSMLSEPDRPDPLANFAYAAGSPKRQHDISNVAKPTDTRLTLEKRMAEAAKRVANCVSSSNMQEFSAAMEELDRLKQEAQALISGSP